MTGGDAPGADVNSDQHIIQSRYLSGGPHPPKSRGLRLDEITPFLRGDSEAGERPDIPQRETGQDILKFFRGYGVSSSSGGKLLGLVERIQVEIQPGSVVVHVGEGSGNFAAVIASHVRPSWIYYNSKVSLDDFMDDRGQKVVPNDLHT